VCVDISQFGFGVRAVTVRSVNVVLSYGTPRNPSQIADPRCDVIENKQNSCSAEGVGHFLIRNFMLDLIRLFKVSSDLAY
jgi:hypothetical protein